MTGWEMLRLWPQHDRVCVTLDRVILGESRDLSAKTASRLHLSRSQNLRV